MANDSRSSHKIMDDKITNSKGRHPNGNSSIIVGSEVRRSGREESSKKTMEPSPSSTWKSEQLEKRTPTAPPVKRKSVMVVKHMPSPLRRSERSKMWSSSSSSGSKSEKSSGSLEAKKTNDEKEKGVKKLTLETKEVKESEKQDTKPVQMNKKRMSARAYKALFITKPSKQVNATDQGKELNRLDKTDSENCRGKSSNQVDRNDHCSQKERKALMEECVGRAGMSSSSRKLSHAEKALEVQNGDGLQIVKSDYNGHVDCTAIENLRSTEVVGSTLNGILPDENVRLEAGHKVAFLKRKRDVDMDSEGKRTEKCDTCLKRQRVDCMSEKQELCSCKIKVNHKLPKAAKEKDRGRLEAGITTAVVQIHDSDIQPPVDLQVDGDHKICLVCNRGGKLLCCEGRGCNRSYHFSCLDPPLEDVPLGIWHCLRCSEKRIEYGPHSVSEVESIWDCKELEVSEAGGSRKQKQFFVKYKGLAHAHNRWVLESKLLLEAPQLVAKFNRENMVANWKQEWMVPQRLLQKRLLMSSKQRSEGDSGSTGGTLDCYNEWLVKWRGLGYEDATWELGNAPFLNSLEGKRLISEYECRHAKANKASFLSRADKILDSDNHDIVNKLRMFLHKGQNAVIIDDAERILKVIMFIDSLQSDVSRPFLIIASSDALYSWETEFLRLVPSVNIVVYEGNKDVRKSIRSLEFFEEGGCIMFQVLISSIEIIVEDLEVLDCIVWEGIIIDDCQHSEIYTHCEQIKMLTTHMRLLLICGQLKDNAAEYLKLLSLLDSSTDLCNTDGLRYSSNDSYSKLKEKLSRYIVNEDKSEFSRFVEYWVPVQLSNIQLEQYCATLLSNSMCLWSPLKNDPVGALRDILISTRKCCDHPYILDPSLQQVSLTEGLVLDFGIKASGKLQLLESMLMAIKNQGLRVLILYQSIGGFGKESMCIGDILDDLMRQRFGSDSYERVDGSAAYAKGKQAALNKFNNKECGRFIFLLETRACLPSIKLSSVDTVIIFGSDWNPVNDIRALQKITIESQSKQMKVFRLYSFCTVEEKVLLLEKHDMSRDSNSQNCTTSHKLLMWGASYLFSKLDKFHGCKTAVSSAGTMTKDSLLRNVVQEFLTILSQSDRENSSSKFILKVKQNGSTYCGNFPLLHERENQLTDEELPQVFWKKLLEGKHPQWKYQSSKPSSQRNRKRVQCFNELLDNLEVGNEGVAKKHKKMVSNCIDPPTLNSGRDEGKLAAGSNEGGFRTSVNDVYESLSPTSHTHPVECEGGRNLREDQKSLYLLLKPDLSKLCETLKLSEDIKDMVDKLFEYVMNNHRISREPATILHAFQISLCWSAASLLKEKIDHKQSLDLSKQHLNFCCTLEEADCFYSKLCCLKHMFLYRTGYLKIANSPNSSFSSKDVPSASSNASNQEQADIVDLSPGINKLVERDISRSIKKLQKKCENQLSKLIKKEHEEVNEIYRIYEEEKAELERKHRTELAVVRCLDRSSAGADRLKMLENAFATKIEQHKQQLNTRLEDLRERQLSARKKEEQRFFLLEDEVKSWSRDELLNRLVSDESRCELENLQTIEQVRVDDGDENAALDKQSSDKIARSLPNDVVRPIETPNGVTYDVVGSGEQIGAVTHPSEKDKLDTVGSAGGFEHTSGATDPTHFISMNLENHAPHVAKLSMPDTQISSETHETVRFSDDPTNAFIVDPPLSGSSSNGTMLNLIDGEVSHQLPGTSHLSDSPQPPDEQVPGGLPETLSSHDGMDVSLSTNPTANVTMSSCYGLENVVSVNPPTQNLDGVISSIPDGKVQIESHVNASSCNNTEKVTSVTSLPSEEQTPDAAMLSISDEAVQFEVLEIVSGDLLESVTINEEINDVDAMTSDRPNAARIDQLNGEGSYINQDSLLQELSPGNAPSDRPNAARIDQQNGEGSNINQDSSLRELSPGNAPAAQSECTLAHGDLLPLNQVLQDQCFLPSISTEVQDGDGPSSKEQHDTQQVEPPQSHLNVDPASSDYNFVAPAIEPVVQSQPLPADSSSDQYPLEIGHPPSTEKQNGTQVTQQLEPPQSLLSNAVQSDSNPEALVIEPAVHLSPIEFSSVHNPPDLASSGETEYQPRSEEQNGTCQVESSQFHTADSERSDHINHDTPVIDPVVQPTIDSSSAHDDHDIPSGIEIENQLNNEEQSVSLHVEPPQYHSVDAMPSEHRINEAPIREPVAQLQVSASTDSSSGHNQPDLPLAGQIRLQPSSEQQTTSQTVLASGPLVDHPQQRQIQTPPVGSQRPLPVYLDPLENELDRIRKEMDRSVKIFEDMKLQLKADCEKEIEVVVAQIRNKYEIKLQETEAEFSSKKKEMDASLNKVHMNKILAEVLRYKCKDGIQQDLLSSFRQQPVQMQQTGQRLPTVTGLSSPSTQPPPAASSQFSPLSATGSHTTAPPQQPIYQSRPFTSIPARSPHISSISCPAGSHQGASEIRAPAPHLQRFRPPTSLSSTGLQALPCGMPNQQAPNNHPASSPPTLLSPSNLPPLPRRMPSQLQAPNIHPSSSTSTPLSSTSLPPLFPRRMPSQQAPNSYPVNSSSPVQPRPPLPTYLSSSSSRAHHPGTSAGLPSASSSALSRFGLFLNVDSLCVSSVPNILSPLPDLGSNLDQLDLSGFGSQSINESSRARAAVSDNIVCLSDDD